MTEPLTTNATVDADTQKITLEMGNVRPTQVGAVHAFLGMQLDRVPLPGVTRRIEPPKSPTETPKLIIEIHNPDLLQTADAIAGLMKIRVVSSTKTGDKGAYCGSIMQTKDLLAKVRDIAPDNLRSSIAAIRENVGATR